MDDDEIGFFERPVPKSLLRFGIFVFVYIILLVWQFWPPQRFDPLVPAGDLFMCVGGLVLWTVFFAQFVLPVNKIGARIKIVQRLIYYVLGRHGPAIFIENGMVRESEGERKKRGPGVIWLDTASAAVLRSPVKFTRTVGPGVHFTTAKEYIAATVDLHSLSQIVGPNDDEHPFIVSSEHADYKDIQKRRYETSALTRDAIEVVASISVTFRIKATAGEGGTPLGFNAENVRKAVTDSLTQGVSSDQPVWSHLPAKMAVDVWREYLRKFKLTQLFEIPEGRSETALVYIGALMKKRLCQDTVEVLDDFGRPLPGVAPVASQEFVRLCDMGLEVSGVTIKRVIFAPEVEDKLIGQWTTLWKKNAEKERDQIERNRKMTEATAQEDALKEFAISASQEISQFTPNEDALKTHALEMLVHSTFLGVRRNSSLLKRASTEQRELAEIFRWLREKRGESNDDLS